MNWGVETASVDFFKDRIDSSIADYLSPAEAAVIGYALKSKYEATRRITVPFSFSAYEKKLEPFIFEFMRVLFPSHFKRFVEKKMCEAEMFMTNPDEIDRETEAIEEAELYLIAVMPERPSRSHYDIRKGVIMKRDRLVERAEHLLAGVFSGITIEDVWLFDVYQTGRDSITRLMSKGRLDSLPDMLRIVLKSGKEPDLDPAYGIADSYRRIEQERMAYLMGLAEERARNNSNGS